MARNTTQYLITATVDGEPLGVFDVQSGGEVTAEEIKHRRGGMGRQEAHFAPVSVANVIINRAYGDGDDARLRRLLPKVGKVRATVTKQPLDKDGNVFGTQLITWTGVLLRVSTGESDSNAADPSTFELEISTDGSVG